ncbi:siderophore-interacting protein [Corynebacterium spheniscorum]|uniref:ATP-binding cassette, subfamily B, IrtA n=1 Tax=Corynebacterium spheniscorum TaxID=185761 RepID=A0A1I2SRF8_9CORY|nr:SIP domain-containing protein [Corynebacterium spheniscorum]KAA8724223.1 siderophore-interacting protein [Corynebacterium spheniscorum]SFG55425.1 ATP-binding cassette, subfamily B, IrtA [Corynebacterium spheniscorum]
MGRGLSGLVLSALGAKTHKVTVLDKQPHGEHMLRIHFHSDTLLEPVEAPGDWLRMWFPDDRGKLYQRGYTMINPDYSEGTFDVDILQHDPPGPAVRWARRCEAGEVIEATRYSGKVFSLIQPQPAGYLFLGDMTSLPAIRDLVAAIPEEVPVVVRLVDRAGDEGGGATTPAIRENLDFAWIPELPEGRTFLPTLEAGDFSGWYAWVAAETVETRLAKTALSREHLVSGPLLHSQAYWIRGRAMGTEK